MAGIGQRLVCEGGSPSRLVATIVDRGLAQRTPGASDRRAVELTAEGQAAAELVAEAECQPYAWLGQTFTNGDEAALIRGLRKLVDGRPTGQVIARRRESSPSSSELPCARESRPPRQLLSSRTISGAHPRVVTAPLYSREAQPAANPHDLATHVECACCRRSLRSLEQPDLW